MTTRKLLLQIIYAIILFILFSVIFQYFIFGSIHYIGEPPKITVFVDMIYLGVPFAVQKVVWCDPSGGLLILCNKVVYNWMMLFVDILFWWFIVAMVQSASQVFQKAYKQRNISLKADVVNLNRRVSNIIIFSAIIIFIIVTLYIVIKPIIYRVSFKDAVNSCGGFNGQQCPQGFLCVYDNKYPDALGKCKLYPDVFINKITNYK